MMVLQRENFLLKTKMTQEEEKRSRPEIAKFTDATLIDTLNKENDKLRGETKGKATELREQTDAMARENLKLAQNLALIKEERDRLKQANKHLRK